MHPLLTPVIPRFHHPLRLPRRLTSRRPINVVKLPHEQCCSLGAVQGAGFARVPTAVCIVELNGFEERKFVCNADLPDIKTFPIPL